MLDFANIVVTRKRTGEATIWADFQYNESSDIMIRGGKFYAVWDEEAGLWSTDIQRLRQIIDKEIDTVKEEYLAKHQDDIVKPLYLRNSSSAKFREFVNFCAIYPDHFHPLDVNITFSNTEVTKESYVSFKLPYAISKGPHPCYDEVMNTLYEPVEREKLEWAIGSVIAGESKSIQKFIVLYGDKGTGKGTALKIFESLFTASNKEKYWSAFRAAELGNPNAQFPYTDFKGNPPLAVDGDGDLSKLEDNTRLNSIVSHENVPVNVKHQQVFYMNIFSFLFIGSNKPVKITDSKSGLLRRLIDVSPTGKKVPADRYDELVGTDPEKINGKIKYEFGAIAEHCLSVYKELGRNYYRHYVPTSMIGATNEFFNFISDNYIYFDEGGASDGGVTLSAAWDKYKEYVEYANVPYPFSKRVFKEELKNYFAYFNEKEGRFVNIYRTFRPDKFWKGEAILDEIKNEEKQEESVGSEIKDDIKDGWLFFDGVESAFDKEFPDIPAQYCWTDADGNEKPKAAWDSVTTTLKDVNTKIVHYCCPPASHIVIDLDIKDENGNKCLAKNVEAANKYFPPTYAEVSKGGNGLHLHYWYDGDVSLLAMLYSDDIEIKKFNKSKPDSKPSPLRRRLSKFNSLPIAHISSGLPLKKGGSKVIDNAQYENERKLRNQIAQCLRKEAQSYTTGNVTFINKLLNEAWDSGQTYDVRDIKPNVQALAASASNQSAFCTALVADMHFCSKDVLEASEAAENKDGSYFDALSAKDPDEEWNNAPIAIFDIEVYPNRNLICYKIYDPPGHEGEHPVIAISDPTPADVDALLKFRLVGYNNRKYDNHILHGIKMGYTPLEVFNLSQNIIQNKQGFYGPAYNWSYTDILDFSHEKKSLKKKEIDLGITHKEMGIPWDKPVQDEMWDEVIKYCGNDVLAAEAVWNSKDGQADWETRCILSELTGLPVNTPTNALTEQLIFGDDKHPQDQFNFPDLSTIFPEYEYDPKGIDVERYNKDEKGKPICSTAHKSIYLGEDPTEGGYNWCKPGVYVNVKCFDVSSMHPSTIRILNFFGDKYTPIFGELVDARLAAKHGDLELASKLFSGRFAKYVTDPKKAKKLAGALKIAINAVYGCTSATNWGNRFTDSKKNFDNKVAKCGALFMIGLKHRVQDLGYEVVHCKTDCIKVANADEFITNYIFEEGKKFGYNFEIEDWFEKFFLANKSAYIGKLYKPEVDDNGKEVWWISKADEFNEPYVFKTLFSHENVTFSDLCQVKSVSDGAIYLDMNEKLPQMNPALIKEMKKLEKAIKDRKASQFDIERYDELCKQEASTHNYIFIGRVSSFVPIKEGFDGGWCVKDHKGKMEAVEGTKGYRWVESETIRGTEAEKYIDYGYYETLLDKAKDDIADWCDFDWFVSDAPAGNEVKVTIDSDKAISQEEKALMGNMESGTVELSNGTKYQFTITAEGVPAKTGIEGGYITMLNIKDPSGNDIADFFDGHWITYPEVIDGGKEAYEKIMMIYDPDALGFMNVPSS